MTYKFTGISLPPLVKIGGGFLLVSVVFLSGLWDQGPLSKLSGLFKAQAAETCYVGSPSGGDDTSKIQSAINNCPSGGIIVLQAGKTYTAGSIYLKSNTTLKFGSADTLFVGDCKRIDNECMIELVLTFTIFSYHQSLHLARNSSHMHSDENS